jgi:hypothetical protein
LRTIPSALSYQRPVAPSGMTTTAALEGSRAIASSMISRMRPYVTQSAWSPPPPCSR